MATVIGLDLGNFNSYPSFIEDLDMENTRLGGKSVDLLPAAVQEGVPSVFFYNGNGGFLAGRAAVSGAAKPERNRIRYLKRSLGKPLAVDNKPVVIDGKTWTYDDAIREVVQSVLREANRELQHLGIEQTNLVSLAYPATYSSVQRVHLVRVVESATTENGAHFKVLGTIMEPAAAALDYLVHIDCKKDTTVLVFDLGGGTFDLSLVTCYPNGKKRRDGTTAYYDIHLSDGLPKVGGCEFDDVVYQLLHAKMESFLKANGTSMKKIIEDQLRQNAEKIKRELTDTDRTVYEAYIPALDDSVPFEVTREEFENAPKTVEMLKQMTDKARELLSRSAHPRPERIVLTGGSCRMPMIPKALTKALPEYAGIIDGINIYKPEKAISYGAARYGAPEPKSNSPTLEPTGPSVVIKHAAYDIGIKYRKDKEDQKGFIECLIPCGTELPVTSRWSVGEKLYDGEVSTKRLYEARTKKPDKHEPERDYRFIKSVSVHFGTSVPAGTPSEFRLLVDKDGGVTLEARKDKNSGLFTETAEVTTAFD